MTELTPLMVSSAPLLRAIAAGGDLSAKALAEASGRGPKNISRDLGILEKAGWIARDDGPALTADGHQVLALLDPQPTGGAPSPAGLDGYQPIPHAQIFNDKLNPRQHFDEDQLEELADSIARDDLLENLVVRYEPIERGEGVRPMQIWKIVAGERRWRAIGKLIKRNDGSWPADKPVPCKVVAIDEAAHRRIALIENLHRADLRPMDEAKALKELMDLMGKGTAELGEELCRTQRWVQQRLQFLELPTSLQEQLNAGLLTVRDAREIVALIPKLPAIKQIELREQKITIDEARDWLARQAEPLELTHERSLIILEVGWAIAAKSNGYWTDTPCDYRVCSLGRTLEQEQLIAFNTNFHTGKVSVRLTPKSYNHLRRISGANEALVRAALEPLLRKARVIEAGGSPLAANPNRNAHSEVDALFKAKRYATKWLNPPHDVDPAVAERLRQRAEEARQADAARAANPEQQETWQQRQARAEANRARGLQSVRQWIESGTFSDETHSLEKIAEIFGAPLPWRWIDSDDVYQRGLVDANGDEIDFNVYEDGIVLQMIVLGAMSKLTGAAAQFVKPKADDDDAAEQSGAEGEQIDLEEAIAATDEDGDDEDLSESVQALATGHARPIAAADAQ